jgi:hypothetical protein
MRFRVLIASGLSLASAISLRCPAIAFHAFRALIESGRISCRQVPNGHPLCAIFMSTLHA